jgi:O-antigen/teichoic acid export membrane protein
VRCREGAVRKHAADIWRFLGALGPTFAALGIQAVSFAVTARGLGAERFGEFSAIVAVCGIGVELVGVGGADLLSRGVVRDPSSVRAYLGNMLLLMALSSPPAWLICFLLTRIDTAQTVSMASVLMLLVGEITAGRTSASLEIVMAAHHQTVAASIVRLGTALARLAASGTAFLIGADLERWIQITVLQSFVVSAASVAVAVRLYGTPTWRVRSAELGTGATFALNQLARAAQGNIDRVVLSSVASNAVLGVYSAGARLVQLGLVPVQVVMRILYPRFLGHGHRGLSHARRYAVACIPQVLGVGVLGALTIAAAAELAPAILGASFKNATSTARYLALAIPLIALQYPPADALTGAGFQRRRTLIYLSAAVGFGALLALGALLGQEAGVAVAFIASNGLLAGALWIALGLAREAGPASVVVGSAEPVQCAEGG